MNMSADILLYALIAAGLVFWLKTILGTRHDDDLDRPSKFSFEDNPDILKDPLLENKKNNIVSLEALAGTKFILPRNVRIDNKTTENALHDISKTYPQFTFSHFAQNLENAFIYIIEAFADGDLETLKNLLAPDVYDAFEQEIKARKARGESVDTTVKSVEKIDITDVELNDENIKITARITAREICVIRDSNGEVISGSPDKITEMVDVWVFGKQITSKNPEWYLMETRDEEIEDHKTPVPDSKKDK